MRLTDIMQLLKRFLFISQKEKMFAVVALISPSPSEHCFFIISRSSTMKSNEF
jgi:hypothetical protein